VVAIVGITPSLGQAQEDENTIVAAYFRDFRNLDPAHLPGSPDYQIAMNVYSGLVRYKLGSTEVEPDLAERWEVSDDGLVYTFFLRDDVMWHHGYGQFTAADVKYSLDRVLDPDTGSRYRASSSNIESVEVIDDFTVRITLQNPQASFLTTVLAFRPGYFVNKQALEDFGEDYQFNPVGTGPFQFVSYTPRQELVLEANPDFYRGEPAAKKIIWKIVPDENVIALALQRDEVNYTIIRNVQILQNLKQQSGLAYTETPTTGYWQFAFNTTREPLNDVRVRQAIAHAVNKSVFAETLLEGQGFPVDSVIVPGMIGHSSDVPTYDHNPDRARELLAEAGLADGFSINVVFDAGSEFGILMANALQQWLSDIGVELELIGLEAGAWTARRQSGDYDITISGTTRADPDQILSEQFHSSSFPPGGNQSYYGEVDDLIEAQRSAVDPAERNRILGEIQQKIAEDVPELALFAPVYVTAYQGNLSGDAPNHIHWMTLFEHIDFAE
jgi:peptide/nickel transport system substrate-binding protein